MIEYINATPFWAAYAVGAMEAPMQIEFGTPSRLNCGLEESAFALSFMSAGAYVQKREELELLLPLGIAARGEVRSVALFTKKEVAALEGETIGVTGESATSTLLLQILCLHRFGINARFSQFHDSEIERFNAFLLIGDQALRFDDPGYLKIDLALEWRKWTGLPMTFAVLATSKRRLAKEGECVRAMQASLQSALLWARAHPEHVVDIAHARSRLPKPLIASYLTLLDYELKISHLEGLELFHRYVQIMG